VVAEWDKHDGYGVELRSVRGTSSSRVGRRRGYASEAKAVAAAKRKAKKLKPRSRFKKNPPPIAVIVGNPSSKQKAAAAKRWGLFHGTNSRGGRGPKETKHNAGGKQGELFLIEVGGGKELKWRGRAAKTFSRHKAYATHDGKALILASSFKGIEGDLELLGDAEYVTYSGRPWSETKRGVWWKHKFGKGVKVYRVAGTEIYIVKGGRFRVTDWLRD
jgi:hypothetical protein